MIPLHRPNNTPDHHHQNYSPNPHQNNTLNHTPNHTPNLFQGFSPHPSQCNNHTFGSTYRTHPVHSLSPNKSPVPKRVEKRKIHLTDDEGKFSKQDFVPDVLLKAMNNSYTRRMSGNQEEINISDVMDMLQEFILGPMLMAVNRPSIVDRDINIRRWCVIALDETYLCQLNLKNSVANFFCGNSSTVEQNMTIENENDIPKHIKLYSLVLNMNNKQLHFQSLEKPEYTFFINLDTISTKFILPQNDSFLSPMILSIDHPKFPLQLKFYITKACLPFPLSKVATEKQKESFLFKNRASLCEVLRSAVQESRGHQFKLEKVVESALQSDRMLYCVNFYIKKNRFVTEEQFGKYCETGDLILFKDNHTFAKLQRFVTNSPFDHIGVIYKSEQVGGVCLFQSNSGTGVGLASWRQLIRFHWFESIERIVWRKLQMHEKPPNFEQKVAQFVKGNLYKQFGLSIPKLLKFRSSIHSYEAKTSYFCSELVATLYKFLGLIEPTKSATQYWPKDFADGNGLEILNGALDPEREIVFQDRILKQNYRFYQPRQK